MIGSTDLKSTYCVYAHVHEIIKAERKLKRIVLLHTGIAGIAGVLRSRGLEPGECYTLYTNPIFNSSTENGQGRRNRTEISSEKCVYKP